MFSKKSRLLIVGMLLPLTTLASGGDAFEWLWIELFVLIGFILMTALAKLSSKRKVLMILVFILTELIIITLTGNMSYSKDKATINSLTVVLPVLTTIGSFWYLSSRQKKKKS